MRAARFPFWQSNPIPNLSKYFKTSPEYSSWASVLWDPQSVCLDQGVGGIEELSHDGDDSDLWSFSGGAKLDVSRLEVGTEPHGGQGWHVECIA
jgi:hypothetical protein